MRGSTRNTSPACRARRSEGASHNRKRQVGVAAPTCRNQKYQDRTGRVGAGLALLTTTAGLDRLPTPTRGDQTGEAEAENRQ